MELVEEGGEIQAGVGRYLEESLDSDFVIATSCTIEAIEFGQALGDGFDLEEGVAACSRCFDEVPDLATSVTGKIPQLGQFFNRFFNIP